MFSNRFAWDLASNALSRLIEDKRARKETLFDLTESNPTRVGLAYPTGQILSALSQPQAMDYAPDPRGLFAARSAIARYYQQHSASVDPQAVFLTASTSDAYSVLFKLLADPGDEILIPRPGYPLLAYLAGFDNLRSVAYPLRFDSLTGWTIDVEVLSALITPKTRAIVVVNPNNPTGSYLKPQELKALDAICLHHNLALVVDEVFSDYQARPIPNGSNPRHTVLAHGLSLTFVLNGFSKMVALPQVKLGWIAVGGQSRLAQAAGRRLETVLDFYLSVNTPVQHAAAPLLDLRNTIQSQVLARIADNSRCLAAQTSESANIRVLPREGGWYAILEIADTLSDEQRVVQLLKDENTLIHPGYFYDFNREGYVVISLLPPASQFQTGIQRLVACFCPK